MFSLYKKGKGIKSKSKKKHKKVDQHILLKTKQDLNKIKDDDPKFVAFKKRFVPSLADINEPLIDMIASGSDTDNDNDNNSDNDNDNNNNYDNDEPYQNWTAQFYQELKQNNDLYNDEGINNQNHTLMGYVDNNQSIIANIWFKSQKELKNKQLPAICKKYNIKLNSIYNQNKNKLNRYKPKIEYKNVNYDYGNSTDESIDESDDYGQNQTLMGGDMLDAVTTLHHNWKNRDMIGDDNDLKNVGNTLIGGTVDKLSQGNSNDNDNDNVSVTLMGDINNNEKLIFNINKSSTVADIDTNDVNQSEFDDNHAITASSSKSIDNLFTDQSLTASDEDLIENKTITLIGFCENEKI